MTTHYPFKMVLFVSLLLVGCADTGAGRQRRELLAKADWPRIRAIAQREVTRLKEDAQWAQGAWYVPTRHSGGVWLVAASSYYPEGIYPGGVRYMFHLSIGDNGEILSYSMTRKTIDPSLRYQTAQQVEAPNERQ